MELMAPAQEREQLLPGLCFLSRRVDKSDKKGGDNMNAKRKVEVFTAGCPLCDPVVELVREVACPSCEVVVYDLNAGCATNECREKAEGYGINRVPAVVVDGRLLECCVAGTVSEEMLRAAGVGGA